MTWPRWGFWLNFPIQRPLGIHCFCATIESPKSQSPLQFCTTSCNHPHMWHLVFFTMAHVIRPRFKQIYLAPGHRGNFLYVGGGYTGWTEVGVNEPLTESYHLERFWHAEVAAAYTLASSGFWPALKLNSRDECLQECWEGKGPASESCKSQKGTALKVSQSWRLVEPSTRCKRIRGWHRKVPHSLLRSRTDTIVFPERATLMTCVIYISG